MKEVTDIIHARTAQLAMKQLAPSLGNFDDLSKGVAAQEGETRTWQGKKYKKVGGKWQPVGAERKKAPESASKVKRPKKDEPKKDPAKGKLEEKERTPVSSADKGQLIRIKQAVGKKDIAEAARLSESLSDEGKNVIPAKVWAKIHEHKEKGDLKEIEDQTKENTETSGKTRESIKADMKANKPFKSAKKYFTDIEEGVIKENGEDADSAINDVKNAKTLKDLLDVQTSLGLDEKDAGMEVIESSGIKIDKIKKLYLDAEKEASKEDPEASMAPEIKAAKTFEQLEDTLVGMGHKNPTSDWIKYIDEGKIK